MTLLPEHIYKTYRPHSPVYALPIGVDPGRFQPFPKYDSREELIKGQILPSELEKKFILLYMGVISNATQLESLVYCS